MMRFRLAIVVTLAVTTLLTAVSHRSFMAQSTSASPAHERLAVFEGTWTQSDLPKDKTFRSTCGWLEGRRHMVCRQRLQGASATAEQMAVYSYRENDTTYTLALFLSSGQVWRYEGKPEGDRWIFNRLSNRPDSPRRLRQIITATQDSLHFIEEISENNGPWRLTDPSEDFRLTRVRGQGQ